MRRIFDKWENLSIKYKLFTITTSLLIGLSIVIFLILYFLLPSYYHKYKIENLNENVAQLQRYAIKWSTDDLIESVSRLEDEKNLDATLISRNGSIVYGGKDPLSILKFSKYITYDTSLKQYPLSVYIHPKDSIDPYKLNIIMPLQPVDEATEVIRNLMPYIIAVAIFIGMIGAYIYSNVITKPLIDIIESERKAETRRKEFVATISHELKTPITIVSGQLEGMIYNIGKYKDRDTYLQKSYESTQELKDLVNEMMEISKAEILEQDLSLKSINLSDLLRKLIKRQQFLIEEKHLKVESEIQDNIYVICDEERITKAINNIINNAIKYSPENESIIIRFKKKNTKRRSNSISHLEIENTGVKIEERYLSEIFKPFFRIEKSRSRKTGGSGLGLYLVSQILESHGFKHSLKNKENSVIFTIIFKDIEL